MLHQELLTLFPTPESIRIITTNFDRHFTTTARDRFNETVDIYYAPALPLGRDLRGLIYLHGAVERPRDRLVLTDADFGRAYLTEGWATRMLVDAFLHYTVLFVGYSHDDPVMRYLARSLVPKTQQRFVLSPPGEEEKWAFLGITPVHFPLRVGSDQYGALADAVKSWSLRACMGALDHEKRIRDIVASPPPLEKDGADYIASVLADPVVLRFFIKHARSPEWLIWADDRGAFKRLFSPNCTITDSDRLIARWFSDHYAFDHPREAFALVQRHGALLERRFWEDIAWTLSTREPRPSANLLNQWVVVLLNSMGSDYPTQLLSYLLSKFHKQDGTAPLLLFNHLTQPRIRPEKSLFLPHGESASPRLRGELLLHGEYEQLAKSWSECLQPQIRTIRHILRPMLTGRIAEAYLLLRGSAGSNDIFDALSYRRSSIAPHEQNRHPTAFDVVIDAARDLLEWLVEHEPVEASALIDEWSKSDMSLLRRLAIHGIMKDRRFSPGEAFEALRTQRWLYAPYLKHEVFCLLGVKYHEATEVERAQLIVHSMKAPVLDREEKETEQARHTSDYERYNVAVWMHRIAPDSEVTTRHLEAMKDAHPYFQEREHPDFDHWSSGAYMATPESPISVEELSSKRPNEILKFLLEFQGESAAVHAPDREGLRDAVRDAVSRSFEWGWELALALQDERVWSSDLWGAVLGGWRTALLEAPQWERILNLLNDVSELDDAFGGPLIELLEVAVEEKNAAATTALWSRMEAIADRVIATTNAQDTVSSDRKDWLGLAINHVAGQVAMLWLKILAARKADTGDSWPGLSDDYRTRFERVIEGSNINSERARTVLAGHTYFLFTLDAKWTENRLLPIFNWDHAALQAEQAWHGFIAWSQWNDSIFHALLPFLKQTFQRIESNLSEIRDNFCSRLAGVALYASFDPWHNEGWLTHFIRDADVRSRECWASSLGHLLMELSPDAEAAAWGRWIRDYWEERLTGVPRPLSERERSEMVEWIFGLELVLTEVVEKILSAPVPPEHHGLFFFRLHKSELPDKHPTAIARLLQHVLAAVTEAGHECGHIDKVTRTLLASGARSTELLGICEAMARIGCPTASEIKDLIETTSPT